VPLGFVYSCVCLINEAWSWITRRQIVAWYPPGGPIPATLEDAIPAKMIHSRPAAILASTPWSWRQKPSDICEAKRLAPAAPHELHSAGYAEGGLDWPLPWYMAWTWSFGRQKNGSQTGHLEKKDGCRSVLESLMGVSPSQWLACCVVRDWASPIPRMDYEKTSDRTNRKLIMANFEC
jgi:hypothetical protein